MDAERDSFWKLPAQIVVGLVAFVVVVIVVGALLYSSGRKTRDAKLDRTSEQEICATTLASPFSASRTQPISADISSRHPEYQPITDAIGTLAASRTSISAQRSAIIALGNVCHSTFP